MQVRLVEEDGQAALSVEDTGVGIAPDALPGLFEAFHQVEADIARSKSGLGLGLAMVKGLIELHGGRVRAASDGVGRAHRFTIWLPLDREVAAPPPLSPLPAPAAVSRRRVLIVEDHSDAAEQLRLLLEVLGCRVDTAANGMEGVRKAVAGRPDLAVVVIRLPELDGCEVARRIRASFAARVILLAYTASDGEEVRGCVCEAGFDAHLVKPAGLSPLLSWLGAAANSRKTS